MYMELKKKKKMEDSLLNKYDTLKGVPKLPDEGAVVKGHFMVHHDPGMLTKQAESGKR